MYTPFKLFAMETIQKLYNLYKISNPAEQAVFKILYKYIKRVRRLYKQPTQQLINLRNQNKPTIIVQPPFSNEINKTHWNDFSFYIPSVVDFRIEVRELNPENSDLSYSPYKFLNNVHNIPEKHLLLILLGDGFSDELLIESFRNLIRERKLPVSILFSIDNLDRYFENRLRRL